MPCSWSDWDDVFKIIEFQFKSVFLTSNQPHCPVVIIFLAIQTFLKT